MKSTPRDWKLYPGRVIALSARRSWKTASWKKYRTDPLNRFIPESKRKRRCPKHLLFLFRRICLIQVESDFDIHLNRNGAAIFLGWIELPGLYAFNGFFIQTHSQGTHYTRIMYAAIRAHNNVQDHHSLILGLARFFRKLRFGSKKGARCAYSITHVKDSRANAWTTVSGANASATAAADSTTNANSIRG